MEAFIDTLKLAHALRDKAGFTQEAAEGAAEALNEAMTWSAATKADIAELRGEIKAVESKINILVWAVGLNAAATVGVLIRHW